MLVCYNKCRSYAVVVKLKDDEDASSLLALANQLAALVDQHTSFRAFVDDKYDERIDDEPIEVEEVI